MALQNIVNININLQSTGVDQAGFGTPLFIGTHRHFNERIRLYTSLESGQDDIPIGSPEYTALQGMFSTIPAPSVVAIGRREADASISIPVVEEAEVYSFTITVNDNDTAAVSYTAVTLDTAEDVVDAFLAAIIANANVAAHVTATKVGTGAATTLSIEATTTTDVFSLSNLSQVEVDYTTVETAPAVLAAIRQENDSFYVVMASDHTETFVLAMAAEVEALKKVYFVSIGNSNALGALVEPAIDIPGKLEQLDYFRTSVLFKEDADTNFPETTYVSRFITKQPGTTDWEVKQLPGVGVSRNPTTLIPLTDTQKNNLDTRNVAFVETVAGENVVRGGKVSSGEWIDTITSRDLLEARLSEALILKRILTDKTPMSNPGIVALRSVVETTANRYVETDTQPNILEKGLPYELTFPRREQLAPADVIAGNYTASGKFYLSGAIRVFTLNADLTYNF